MFSFPHLLMSYVIMFVLVLKQSSFDTLILLDSREDFPGSPRSFLDLRFDQHSYPLLSWDIRSRPRSGYATSRYCTIVYLDDIKIQAQAFTL